MVGRHVGVATNDDICFVVLFEYWVLSFKLGENSGSYLNWLHISLAAEVVGQRSLMGGVTRMV